jgi:hypothetical protein
MREEKLFQRQQRDKATWYEGKRMQENTKKV